jgi:hypothetical protein
VFLYGLNTCKFIAVILVFISFKGVVDFRLVLFSYSLLQLLFFYTEQEGMSGQVWFGNGVVESVGSSYRCQAHYHRVMLNF